MIRTLCLFLCSTQLPACALIADLMGTLPPLNQHKASYEGIVQQLRRGALEAGCPVALPEPHQVLGPRGEYFVDRQRHQLLVLFPTWQGRGKDVQGWLWASDPSALPRGGQIHMCGIDHLDVTFEQNNWFRAIRRMD